VKFKILLLALWSILAVLAGSNIEASCLGKCAAPAQYRDPRLGINYDDTGYLPYATVDTAMTRVRDAHLGTVRLWAWWKWMEPSPGSIDFSNLDNHVYAARARGLNIVLVFTSIPPWANGSSPSCDFWGGGCAAPPTSSTYFGNFVSAVVNRYKNEIGSYELWNEADYAAFWTGTMAQLNSMIVQPGSAAIRSLDPCATIASPSFYNSKTSLKILLGMSCSAHDAVAVHFYEGDGVGDPALLKTRVNGKWTNAMVEAGCVQPLWVTEYGIDSVITTEAGQAQKMATAASYILNGSMNAEKLIFYRVEDYLLPTPDRGWGITRTPPTYQTKPSHASLQSTIPLVSCKMLE
jgi:hypothetical protein